MRKLSGRAAALGVVACAFSIPAFAAVAPTGWVATSTKALHLQPSVATTPVPASQRLHIAVSLKLQNKAALDAFIKNQHTSGNPQYGQTMTPDQFAANYSPTAAQARAVADYLASQGFTNIVIAPNRLIVSADATATAAQKAFNTSLAQFSVNGKTYFAATQDAMVPDSLNGVVLSVLGISHVPHTTLGIAHTYAADEHRRGFVKGTAGTPDVADNYTPDQTRVAYNADSIATGAGTVIGISTSNTDFVQVTKDLRQFEKEYKLPQVPLKFVNVGTTVDDPNADVEWDLDVQSSTGIAGNVKQVIFYNASDLNDDATMVEALTQFATDNVAKVGNMSYGGCESILLTLGASAAYDQAFMQAVAHGQTWFASSGDAGAACGFEIPNIVTPDTGLVSHVEYPASSPYVVAVGGTSLFIDSTTSAYFQEIAWTAGGGGTSMAEQAPDWQLNDAAATSAFATGYRSVPDIAMTAGGAVALAGVGGGSAAVVNQGSNIGVTGTSWSSPMAVGSFARMQSAHCNSLGFAAPLFYALDATQAPSSTATGFHDIVVGNNGQWNALPGFDNTTGYGTFDIGAVNAALPAVPSGCSTTVAAPTAALAVDASLGPSPLATVFDGSASTDPAGLAITNYAMDFGDGNSASQATPLFPAHSYAYPGTYAATLQVTNAKGGVSTLATKTVAAFGTPQSCLAGGQTMLTSPAGDATLEGEKDIGNGTDDLLSTSFSEPASMPNKLVITVKTATLSGIMPGFRWVTYFDVKGRSNPNDEYYYVSMNTANGPTPVFNYGIHTYAPGPEPLSLYQPMGVLDASTETADGTITLVLDKSAFNLKTGDVLTSVYTSTRTTSPEDPTGTAPGGAGLTQDSAGASLPYTIVGNATCGANHAPTAALSALPASGLTVTLNGGGSTDPDAQDSVSYFKFDFGDGYVTPWQTSASAQHAYSSAGSYPATLIVADSRGMQAAAPASLGVTAAPAGNGGGTTTGGSTGSTTGGSTGGSTGGTTGSTGGGSETVTASLSATPTSGSTPLQVAFDASKSSVSNGTAITKYTFYFGDDSQPMDATAPTVSYTYTGAGSFDAVVVATDANGYTATSQTVRITATTSVTVTPTDHSIAILTVTPTSGSVPLTVHFDGSRSQGANGNAVTTWTFDFGDGAPVLASTNPKVDHVYTAVGTYNPTLSVTDEKGNVSPSKAMAQVKAVGTSGTTTGTAATGGGATAAANGGGAIGGAVLLPLLGLAALRRRRRG